jgi:hypothetical protein
MCTGSSASNKVEEQQNKQKQKHVWHENTLKALEYKNELRLEEETRHEERKREEKLERSFRRGFIILKC